MVISWKMRLVGFLSFLAFSYGIVQAQVNLDVRDVTTGKQIKEWEEGLHFTLMPHQIEGLEFSASFGNASSAKSYSARLTVNTDLKGNYKLPYYVEGWQEKTGTLPPNSSIVLKNEIWIRPIDFQSPRVDSFVVEAWLRYGMSPANDPLDISRIKIYIHLIPLTYNYPVLLREPVFTNGLANTLRWIPAPGTVLQEAYYFDRENPANLKKAVQRLYKPAGTDTLETVFEGLRHDHEYGYFIKAVFNQNGKSVPVYSDFQYSKQDASAPAKVETTQAVRKEDGSVWLTWKKSNDDVSGVSGYRIYRAFNTDLEQLLDSVSVGLGNDDLLTWQDPALPVSSCHYRVRAVDGAGNEGDGAPSNEIFQQEIGKPINPPSPSPSFTLIDSMHSIQIPRGYIVLDSVLIFAPDRSTIDPFMIPYIPFARGIRDTLRVELSGKENSVRFQVVRDSLRYFQSPPAEGFRVFDTGWLPLSDIQKVPGYPGFRMWPIDYTRQGQVDSQFVNGHAYYRRAIRRTLGVDDTVSLGAVRMDCFPPDDIHDLKIQALILDPESEAGHTQWHFQFDWKPAKDASSGLKRYRVFRKIGNAGSDFKEIQLPDDWRETHLSDSIDVVHESAVSNPMVSYRVVSEDRVGNLRPIDKTLWEVGERALGCPEWSWKPSPPMTLLLGQDTLFTKNNTVSLVFNRFDISSPSRYLFEINGRELRIDNPGTAEIVLNLPEEEISQIRIRALYPGGISGVWSVTRWAVKVLSRPVQRVTAWNDTSYWGGHVYLKWGRPSLDVKEYEIWRYRSNGDSVLAGRFLSRADSVVWTDYYDRNEITNQSGDVLTAYEMLQYRVRKVNLFDDSSVLSPPVRAYSNRPPRIVSSAVKFENNQFVIQIRWKRPYPNAVPKNVTTWVRVDQDGLDQPIVSAVVTDDDSSYTFRNAFPGRNYIFRIKEIVNDDALKRMSGWSQPYTKSLREIRMDVQPQPLGGMFIAWDRSAVDSLHVRDFLLQRTNGKDTLNRVLPNTVSVTMDTTLSLIHATVYRYTLFALDSLNQVLAAHTQADTCDHGAVYIPAVLPFSMKYFHSNTIDVSWEWKTVSGRSVSRTTRGARDCLLQVSVSKYFPSDTSQTRTIGPFAADAVNRTMRVPIPRLGNRENERVYLRMTARDAWSNPQKSLWSTDFYGLVEAVFDSIRPVAVTDFIVGSLKSYYKKTNSVTAELRWISGAKDPSGVVDPLVTNVERFRIYRLQNGMEKWVVDRMVDPRSTRYSVLDTIPNAAAQWRIVSIDSAGNSTSSGWIVTPVIVPTPPPPKPEQYRVCQVQSISVQNAMVEYAVEIAMRPDHFHLAYELEPGSVSSRLICSSGWFSGGQFVCPSGWGKIETDTTFFRIKARIGLWESGWSQTSHYTDIPTHPGQNQGEAGMSIPSEFAVSHNYPNPFNAETRVLLELPEKGLVRILVFSVAGSRIRQLVDGEKSAGRHAVVWDGRDEGGESVSSGIYLALATIYSENGTVYQKRIKMMMIK